MGAHTITFSNVVVPSPLDIQIGDTINYKGEIFTINTVDEPIKHSNFNYEYNIVFEGIRYQLYDKLYMFEGETDFPFYGTLRDHLQLLIDNISQTHTGWSLGIIEETEAVHSNWDRVSCRVALTNIAELFKMEWYLTGKTINMVKVAGNTTTIQLAYGKGKGLYNLSRQYVEDKNIVTRVYGKGGTRNLPPSYGGTRLSLPEKYLEANVDKYGIKEGVYSNDEIYPKREGALTAVGPYENADQRLFTVSDGSLEFDINNQLMEGVDAKIAFNTGELAGYDFIITRYDHSSKTITFKAKVSDQDYVMPNQNFMPAVGDKYVLWDIRMPQSYEVAAVTKLREETAKYRDQNSVPQVLYGFSIDVLDMKRKGWMINPGDKVRLEDEPLKINEEVRIYSISYPIQFPDILEPGTVFEATVANFIPYTVQERIIKDTIENQKEIKVVDRRNAERARQNAMNLRQLRDLIFDPDDYFDTSNIRPNSIETVYLSVGAKSQNFGLNGVNINANTNANPNHLTISQGSLIHFEISIEGLGYVWLIGQGSFPNLDPSKAYYLSAKCSRTSLSGQWYLSESPMKAEQEVGYYHFNVGILYPVNSEGFRGFDFTKGMTYIVGDTITTGVIRSLDGLNFYDLSQGKFNLGDETSGIDWDVTNPGVLTIRGAVASSTVMVGSGGFISAGLSGLSDNGDQSVRFWGGADLLNKDTAPFRVLNNGYVYATNLTLGYGTSSSGNSNGWRVSPSGIISDYVGTDSNFALIRGSDLKSSFAFATDLIPASSGGSFSLTGRLINKKLSPSEFPIIKNRNTALELEASGADTNVALDIKGGTINLNGNNIVVTDGKEGKSFTLDFRVGGESWYKLEFINGVVVGITDVTNS